VEKRRGKNNKVFRGVWKVMETKVKKTRIAKAEEEGKKRGKRKSQKRRRQ